MATSSQLVKAVGRIAELAAKTEGVEGTAGIGHTRWANRGKPTERQCSPTPLRNRTFRFGSQMVLLKKLSWKLIKEYLSGHHFKGQADTGNCSSLDWKIY